MKAKKICFMVIYLCILLSFFVKITVGYANEYYYCLDDFSLYDERMYSQYSVQMNNNWRTASSDEYVETSMNLGYEKERLKINTNTSTVDIKYTTGNAKRFPAAVFNGDRTNLSSAQKMSVKVKKTHQSDMWGIRFYVHNGAGGELNYYTLFFGGMYTTAYNTNTLSSDGFLTWGLYKCKDGTVNTLNEKTRASTGKVNDVDGFMGTGDAVLNVEIIDGKIKWELKYSIDDSEYIYSDTYYDSEPFDIKGEETTVHLYAAGSDTATRYVYFDDFVLENNWIAPEFTEFENKNDKTAEKNAIYINLLDRCSIDDYGIVDLGSEHTIDEIYYTGNNKSFLVLVSKDKDEWFRIASTEDLTNGQFVNNVTEDSYRYVYADKDVGDILLLNKPESIKLKYTDGDVVLYPRLSGKDYFTDRENVISSSNTFVAEVDGIKVMCVGIGSAVITASDGVNTVELPIEYVMPYGEYIEPEMVLYRNILADTTLQNGKYTLKVPCKIGRFICSSADNPVKVYVSYDGSSWYMVSELEQGEDFLNRYYSGEYKYIRVEGEGVIEALARVDEESVLLFPGETLKIYTYYNGEQRSDVQIEDKSGYVTIDQNNISLPINLKQIDLNFKIDQASVTMKAETKYADLECMSVWNNGLLNLDITSFDLTGEDNILQVMTYNSDHSLRNVSLYNMHFADGKASVEIDNTGYVGTYTNIRVINDRFVPLTKLITIN